MQQDHAVAISGMGGIGKTELAVQYAWRHLKQKTYPGGVIWLKAREDVVTQVVLFARSLPLPQPPDDYEPAEKVKFYWRNWQKAETLVILDDVQDYRTIKPLLPVDPHFKLLLTTRPNLRLSGEPFEIKVLSEEKAIELLGAIVTDGRIDQGLATTKQICQWLGYLPLGIELVGRYLARKPDTSLATLWQRLQDKKLEAKALKDTAPEMTAPLGVAAAFELSWQELGDSAQQLAALLSLFALAEIPWMLVEACFMEDNPETLEDQRDESLLNLHLLERTGEGMYRLHQLLREFFAAKCKQMINAADIEQAFRAVMLAEAQRSTETPERSLFAETTSLIPHLQAVVQLSETSGIETDVAIDLTWMAQLYRAQGRYTEAEPLYTRAFSIYECQLGADHPHVATSLNNLALLYEAQGRYTEAEPLFTRALDIRERQLGAAHPYVATSLGNLAELYRLQGRYTEAEPLFTRAFSIYERQLEAEHPDVAGSLNDLALLYKSQGRYTEAEPLFTRALNIYERQLGVDHPYVATSLGNLAELHRLQGRYAEAIPLCTRALDIDEHQLGSDHPHVAIDLNNLALLYEAQGRYSEAESLYTRALTINEHQLGSDHPEVANSINNLALLYEAQGRYSEAEPLYTHALNIYEHRLGADHPAVANSLNNLAYLYKAQGRYSETKPLYLRALTILFEKLGADHPNTQGVWQNFVGFLQQVLEAGQTAQLSDHPRTQDLLRQMREGNRE